MPTNLPESVEPEKHKIDLDAHYNASQLRIDTWNHLKHTMDRLGERYREGADCSKLKNVVSDYFNILAPIENYWAFPGKEIFRQLKQRFIQEEYPTLSREVTHVVRMLISDLYRYKPLARFSKDAEKESQQPPGSPPQKIEGVPDQHYFAVLFVDNLAPEEEQELRHQMLEHCHPTDKFVYDIVFAPSFEDALIAVMFNYNIQCCVIRYGFPLKSQTPSSLLRHFTAGMGEADYDGQVNTDRGPALGEVIHKIRPELDLYLVTDASVEEIATHLDHKFQRIFYRQENYLELHLSIQQGVQRRFNTPFFNALKEYSRQPTGVFHAMPISRGNSVFNSHWIQDMSKFYGDNIFLAETSATTGGLDSLLQPTGPLKQAQEYAAKTFGARQTFFVTNGTSTANKIVVQALIRPGDIILVDRDCHKSHHYGMVLAGAHTIYLDAYALEKYSLYGAIPLVEIKKKLLHLKREGQLDKVRMLLLTNCTFDGFVYNVERIMAEVLAIKPDMIFLWDEAWFGFARFTPTYRKRTAMDTASRLVERFKSDAYRATYRAFRKKFKKLNQEDEQTWLQQGLLPDPDQVRVRVYATQSTHKTLSCLRQGSMIHIHDQDFNRKAEMPFMEAYMAHTSTSPNYQILASLDIARRQMEFEGFELVQASIERAMTLREKIKKHPLLKRYFQVLAPKNLIPKEYRQSGVQAYYDPDAGWSGLEEAWDTDEIVLDPTRITLYVGNSGIDGYTFRNKYLMDQFNIQINKTSLNTVLFMTNIGTTRSAAAFLLEVLVKIAQQLDQELSDLSPAELKLHDEKIDSLTNGLPPLPDFSHFHPCFRPNPATPEGDMRTAYFLAYDEEKYEYLKMDGTIAEMIAAGREVVSASFIIPYPPGFPILVPGQVISLEILTFMKALDIKEIHGYRPDLGLLVFTEEALDALKPTNRQAPSRPKTKIISKKIAKTPSLKRVARTKNKRNHNK